MLTVAQLVTLPCILWRSRFSITFKIASPPLPSRGNVYLLTPNFLILTPILNTILPRRTTSPKRSISLKVSVYSCTCISYRPLLFYLPRPSQRHEFHHTKNIWQMSASMLFTSPSYNFPHPPINLFSLDPNILVTTFS